MFLKLKIIDRFSLKPVKDCIIKIACQEYTFKHTSDGELIVGLPKNRSNCSLEINAPMYKGMEYNIERIDESYEQTIDLEFIELFEEDTVTA